MGNDKEQTMAWFESSLDYARDRRRAKLRSLLESVRDEVVWEAEHAKFACRRFPEVRRSSRLTEVGNSPEYSPTYEPGDQGGS